MKKYVFFLFFLTLSVQAETICRRLDGGIVNYLKDLESRISFNNSGGLLNGGVCWWHSRLQRASSYLVEFRPELPIPTSREVKIILKKLKAMDSLVVLPGFSDFKTFTTFYKKETQNLLEVWQKEDGFVNQQWVRGISGKYKLEPNEMKRRMERVFDFFNNTPRPMWIMAQIRGITSHAFLVLDMEPTQHGYELKIIDSNFPLITKTIKYQFGDKFLKHEKDKYSFVPYVGFQKDYVKIFKVIKYHCYEDSSSFENIPEGEIEL